MIALLLIQSLVFISGSGVGSGSSEVEGELGSGFSVPQLVQNFSSAEISEPHSSQNRLGFSDMDTILAW